MSRRSGVLYSYLLLLTEIVSSLLYTPYLIRSLGQTEYGLYSLAISITAYFLLLDAGVGNALVRYVAKFRARGDVTRQRVFLGLSLVFYAVVGALIGVLGAALRSNLGGIFGYAMSPVEQAHLGDLLSVTLAGAAISLLASVFDRTIIAYERFALSKLLSMAKLALRAVTVSVLLWMGYGALAAVLVNLAVTVIFGLVSGWYVLQRIELRPSLKGASLPFLAEVFSYSGLIFVQMIAAQINATADQVLLGIMTAAAVVGVYAVGAQVSNYFQMIAGSINGVLMPGVVQLVEGGAPPERLLDEMVKVGRLVLMVLGIIFVGFAVAGDEFVALWAGRPNAEAYWVALILMGANLFYLTQNIGTQILWAMGRHKVQAWLNVLVALANVGLTVVLIKWEPLIGASLGTAVAVIVGNVAVMNVVFSRQIGIRMAAYYQGLLRGVIPCLMTAGVAGAVAGQVPVTGWAKILVEVVAILVAYVAGMLRFGMNAYEKQLVVSVLRRLGLRGRVRRWSA